MNSQATVFIVHLANHYQLINELYTTKLSVHFELCSEITVTSMWPLNGVCRAWTQGMELLTSLSNPVEDTLIKCKYRFRKELQRRLVG